MNMHAPVQAIRVHSHASRFLQTDTFIKKKNKKKKHLVFIGYSLKYN